MRLDFLLSQATLKTARRPGASLFWCMAIALICVVATVALIEFRTKRSDLIDPKATFHQRWLNFTAEFGEESDIVVVVEADREDEIKDALSELGSRLQEHPEHFRDVLYRLQFDQLKSKGLQTLSEAEVASIRDGLPAMQPFLDGQWEVAALDVYAGFLTQQLARSAAQAQDAATDAPPIEQSLKQTDDFIQSLSRFMANRQVFESPWPSPLPNKSHPSSAKADTWLIDDSGAFGVLNVFPVYDPDDFQGATRSIQKLREIIGEVETLRPGVQIGLTGIPVLEHDEMMRSQQDMIKASAISTVGVAILLLVGFRGLRHPLLAMIMLAVAMCWAFGFTTGVIGRLNILSVSFAVILIGLGIDFSIHYLASYLQLRHEGQQLLAALEQSSTSVGMGIVTAAITTSLGFFCATMTTFLGVAELGIIAGGGVLLCALATFAVLPPLVVIADRNKEPTQLPTPFQGQWLRILISQRPILMGLASILLIALLAAQATRSNASWYDSNLLHLQADGVASVELQKRLFTDDSPSNSASNQSSSILYAVSLSNSLQEAREREKQFAKLPTVSHVQHLASELPEPASQNQLAMIAAIEQQLSGFDASKAPSFTQTDPSIIGPALEQLLDVLNALESDPAKVVSQRLDELLDYFEELQLEAQIKFLDDYQNRTVESIVSSVEELRSVANPERITADDFPDAVKHRFVSDQGRWLLKVFPDQQIWDDEPLEQFVRDVRSVDPEVTGTPLQNYEASRQIRDSYGLAAVYALAVISIVLLVDFLEFKSALLAVTLPLVAMAAVIGFTQYQGHVVSQIVYVGSYTCMVIAIGAISDFRSVRDMILTLMPPLAGGCLMFGILVLLDAKLNPANLIVLPLVLGIGVDDGVHVLHDFRLQTDGKKPYRMSVSTLNGIVLTSLTSMIGFGSMLIAAHRGLFSLGLVLVVGVGSCLFVSLVTLPALLTVADRFTRRRRPKSAGRPAEPPDWNYPF